MDYEGGPFQEPNFKHSTMALFTNKKPQLAKGSAASIINRWGQIQQVLSDILLHALASAPWLNTYFPLKVLLHLPLAYNITSNQLPRRDISTENGLRFFPPWGSVRTSRSPAWRNLDASAEAKGSRLEQGKQRGVDSPQIAEKDG